MRHRLLFLQSEDNKTFHGFLMNDITKMLLNDSIITTQRLCFRVVLHTITKGLAMFTILKLLNKKHITNNKLMSLTRKRWKLSVDWLLKNKKKRRKRGRQGKERGRQQGGQAGRFIGKTTNRKEIKDHKEESIIYVILTKQLNLFLFLSSEKLRYNNMILIPSNVINPASFSNKTTLYPMQANGLCVDLRKRESRFLNI
jgi:hypothetical protein